MARPRLGQEPDKGLIYALSLDGAHHRYVGRTARTLAARVGDHRARAVLDVDFPVYHWMRENGPDTIRATTLEVCGPVTLVDREAYWVELLRAEGHDLLNVFTGGSVKGAKRMTPFSDETLARQAASALHRRVNHPWSESRLAAAYASTGVSVEDVVNCWNEGLSTRKIAERVGLSPSAIRNRLIRAGVDTSSSVRLGHGFTYRDED